MISLRKILVKTANGKVLVQETSLEVAQPMMIGIYGPNGSGKTCLLKSISGQAQEREILGESWIDQRPILHSSVSVQEKSQKVLYLSSDFHAPFQISVRELLEMAKGVNPASGRNISEVSERFGITSLLSRSFDEMSDGEKQRVMVARGVIQSPKWLILDETFSKIDIDRSFQIAEELKEAVRRGMGVIFASHDLNLVSEMSDELWLMKDGRILVKGPVEDIFTTDNLQQLYPERMIHVVRSPDHGKKKVIY